MADAFICGPNINIRKLRVEQGSQGQALIWLDDLGSGAHMQIKTVEAAAQLVDAAIDAMAILDPEGPLNEIRKMLARIERHATAHEPPRFADLPWQPMADFPGPGAS